MIEVEIKVPITDPEIMACKLSDLGFVKGTAVYEEDVYFNGRERDFHLTDEALRIRKHVDLATRETKFILNYKGRRIDDITMARDEHQTIVYSAEKMQAILDGLGYLPYSGVVKTRQHYKLEQMTACLDSVENLGNYLELEILAETPEEYDRAVASIESTLCLLGLSMQDTIRKSYLTMLEEK